MSHPSHPSPTSRDLMQEDFEALAAAFQLSSSLSPEALRCFAIHHTATQLVALGWIREMQIGRWSRCFVPAGDLANHLTLGPFTLERGSSLAPGPLHVQ